MKGDIAIAEKPMKNEEFASFCKLLFVFDIGYHALVIEGFFPKVRSICDKINLKSENKQEKEAILLQ